MISWEKKFEELFLSGEIGKGRLSQVPGSTIQELKQFIQKCMEKQREQCANAVTGIESWGNIQAIKNAPAASFNELDIFTQNDKKTLKNASKKTL